MIINENNQKGQMKNSEFVESSISSGYKNEGSMINTKSLLNNPEIKK